MKGDKIQTGLRIPEPLYKRLYDSACQNGASVNAQILYLLDIGLKAVDLGIREAARTMNSEPYTISTLDVQEIAKAMNDWLIKGHWLQQ